MHYYNAFHSYPPPVKISKKGLGEKKFQPFNLFSEKNLH